MGRGEKVLVIGRHVDMLNTIVALLQQHGYVAIGTLTNEAAFNAFKQDVIDAVIIGGGVDDASRQLFYAEFPTIHPHVKLINAHPQTVLSDLKLAFQS